MNKTLIFGLMAVGAILAACSSNDDLQNAVGNGTTGALQINAGIYTGSGVTSRAAINNAMFSNGAQLGIFVGSPEVKNRQCSTTDGASWVLSGQAVELTATATSVNAYYPYNSEVTDIASVPVSVKAEQIQSDGTDNQVDYMWAGAASVSSSNSTAYLTMKHALSQVSFKFSNVSYEYAEDGSRNGVISYVALRNTSASNQVLKIGDGTLNATTGALTLSTQTPSVVSVASNIYLFNSNNKKVSPSETANLIIYPTTNSDEKKAIAAGALSVALTIDGKLYVAELPQAPTGYQAGNRYVYPINIKEVKKETSGDNTVEKGGTGYTNGEGQISDSEGNQVTKTTVPTTYSDGSPVYDASGNMLYPDGTKVTDDPDDASSHMTGKNSGETVTTYSNGQEVLDKDASGNTTGMNYPNGTDVTDSNGNKVGTSSATGTVATKTEEEQTKVGGNTQVTTYTYSNGNPIYDSNGNMLYPDGTKVSDNPTDPENHMNGCTTYSNGKDILGTDATTGEKIMKYPDETTVKDSDGDAVGSSSVDGSKIPSATDKDSSGGTASTHAAYVTYSDGSPVADSEGNPLYPDGTKIADDPTNPSNHMTGKESGKPVTTYSNGQKVQDEGTGGMNYPNGTTVTVGGQEVKTNGEATKGGETNSSGNTGAGTNTGGSATQKTVVSIGTVSIENWITNTLEETDLIIK